MQAEAKLGVVIVAHGAYADPLVRAAESLVGPLDVHVMHIEAQGRRDDTAERLTEVVAAADQGKGVLIIADLCGSTPANVCESFLVSQADRQLVLGLNLAMLMKLATIDRQGAPEQGALQTVAQQLVATGQRSVMLSHCTGHKSVGGSRGD